MKQSQATTDDKGKTAVYREATPSSPASTPDAPSPALPIFSPGETVAERFWIVRFLGQGGMGQVFEAEDLELEHPVAIKVIRPEIGRQTRAIERFKREVQLARQVTHPNVCRIFDLFYHQSPTSRQWGTGHKPVLLLSMEMLRGETLAQHLERAGPLAPPQALPLIREMAAALDAAHAEGIVHRDFKCGNVMLVDSRQGVRAVITDFGLASSGGREPGLDELPSPTAGPAEAPSDLRTHSLVLGGTPAYVAPEQVTGEKITAATDVYSFGVVIYEMLTGILPYRAATPEETARQRLVEDPPPPRRHRPDLDPAWETAILRCLRRQPEERFGRAGEVAEFLLRAAQTGRRRRAGLALLLIAVLALAGGLLAVFRDAISGSRAPRPSVAVLGFRNLSPHADVAWLSTALAELLSAELATDGKLRLIAGESVARMKRELGLGDPRTLAEDTLRAVGANLGTDYVILGSYLSLPRGESRELRLQVNLQSTTGETLAAVTVANGEKNLPELVFRAAAAVREKLGVGELTAAESAAVRATLSASPEAARLYAEGLDALRASDNQAARRRLEQAVAADPDYALAHAALSEAYLNLGYDVAAAASGKAALELASELPREEFLWIQGRYYEAAGDLEQAVETYRLLAGFYPDNIDYSVRLITAQVAGYWFEEAVATAEELRQKLPPPVRDDPRLDAAAAKALYFLGDYPGVLARAREAVRKGQALQAWTVIGDGHLNAASALIRSGHYGEGAAVMKEAKRLYERAGDRSKAAYALTLRGSIVSELCDPSAEQSMREGLAIQRELGARRQIPSSLFNIGYLLLMRGELTEATAVTEEAGAIGRELNDQRADANTYQLSAQIALARGELSAAEESVQHALAVLQAQNSRYLTGWGFVSLGEISFAGGDFGAARNQFRQAKAISEAIGSEDLRGMALLGLAKLHLAADELAAAGKSSAESRDLWSRLEINRYLAESKLIEAQLALARGQWRSAIGWAQEARELLERCRMAPAAATASAVAAEARWRLGEMDLGRAELVASRAWAEHGEVTQARLAVAIAAARLPAAEGEDVVARRELGQVIDEAARLGLTGVELAARRALGELEMRRSETADRGKKRLRELADEAAERGFGLISRQAREASRATPPMRSRS